MNKENWDTNLTFAYVLGCNHYMTGFSLLDNPYISNNEEMSKRWIKGYLEMCADYPDRKANKGDYLD